MLIILSPAKTLDFESKTNTSQISEPLFADKASVLIELLKKYSVEELMKLMTINRQLANLNHGRFQTWSAKSISEYSKPAISAFKGEVYHGLEVKTWNEDDYIFSQSHLLILSGLYGVLRPLDLINPYRLEMGTKMKNPAGSNLYQYWEETINQTINIMIGNQSDRTLVNLASNEYFKSILPKKISGNIITPVFKDFKDGDYQVITIYAKKARGSMAKFAITNKIENVVDLKAFDIDRYLYNERLSSNLEWVFTRE